MVSFRQVSPPKRCAHPCLPTYVPHAPPISFFVEKIALFVLNLSPLTGKSSRLTRCGKPRYSQIVDNIIRRVRFACWLTKTSRHALGYVIPNCCPQQLWLRQRVSVLRLYAHYVSCRINRTFPSNVKSRCIEIRLGGGLITV